MKPEKTNQVDTLLNFLLTGAKIDRVSAFKWFGIADLRSRISDVEREYQQRIARATKPGKKYREYWIDLKSQSNAKTQSKLR